MAKQWKIRRGTSVENDNFAGAVGEVTMDTTNKTLRVHTDGATPGGTSLVSIETLKTIYPVGAVYIGTTSTCPMASLFGTWESIGTSLVTSLSGASIKGNGQNIHIHTTAGGNANKDAKMQYNNNETLVLTAYDGWHDQYDTNDVYFGDLNNNNVGLTVNFTKTSITVNMWKRTA